MAKKYIMILLCCSILVLGVTNLAVSQSKPSAEVVPNKIVLDKNQCTIIIQGEGFKPGQEVSLVFTTKDGVMADIGYALEPAPVANDQGAWATAWKASRFVSKGLVEEDTYTITVLDENYDAITEAQFEFVSK